MRTEQGLAWYLESPPFVPPRHRTALPFFPRHPHTPLPSSHLSHHGHLQRWAPHIHTPFHSFIFVVNSGRGCWGL